MDRLEAMGIFVKVVELGSLSATSRKLGIPLTTVSRNISDLESYLKTKLLHRTTRKLELTDAGRLFLSSSKRILEEIDEAEQITKGEFHHPKGNLIVTAPFVFGRLYILPLVTKFLKKYPEINIQLILTDRIVHLVEEKVDLAIRIGELPDSSLTSRRIGITQKVTCASPKYLQTNGTPKTLQDLKKHECISIESMGPAHSWKFSKGKNHISTSINPRLIVPTVESGIDAAISGLGVSRSYCYQVDSAIKAKKLKLILEEFDSPSIPVSLLYSSSRVIPQKLRSFIDFIAPELKKKVRQA